ncbi:MAG: sugar ABC transporter permease [Anaerolineae bacterium]|nr:sugar ABC transporter permease [Anaerolineae bacterium]
MTSFIGSRRTLIPYIFLLPAVVILAVGLIVPLFTALRLSFYEWSMGTPLDSARYVGLAAYERLAGDAAVGESLGVTLRFGFWVILVEMALGILLALILERPIRGAGLFRTIFVLPLMVSPVVVGLIWRYLFDARSGLINYYLEQIGEALPFLQQFGFTTQLWLADRNQAFTSIIITDIWQWTPFVFIIILAGLQAVSSDITEAAHIDGANWLQMTLFVKLPMIRAIILITLLLRLVDVFRALEVVFILTFGGPGRSTELLSLHIYKTAFTSQQLGYASAISTLLIGVIFVLSLGILVFSNPLKERAG